METMSVFLEEEMKPSLAKKQRRREKSRDAARHRRTKETVFFQEIANLLPIPHDLVSNLDRSSVMRLVNSYIKLRQSLTGKCEDPNTLPIKELSVKQEVMENDHILGSDDYVNALNGFLFILSPDFDILYCTANVRDYLGLSKLDLIGQSILTFVHEGDHEEIRDCFSGNSAPTTTSHKAFFLRMKSTLTVNGKSINLKSASYKVLQCNGFRKAIQDSSDSSLLVVQAEPIPHPSNIEHFLDSKTFLTQHTPDMKFSYCDERMTELLGYSESDMIGKSFFSYCHVLDIKPLEDFFHKLYRLNQIETSHYRFLAKTGGYHWIVSQATVIPCTKNQKPQCIVCVHYVLSGPTHADVVFSTEQHQSVEALPFSMVPVKAVLSEEEEKELSTISQFVLEDDENNEDNETFIDSLLKDPEPPAVRDHAPPSYGDFKIVPLTLTDMDENDEIDVGAESMLYNAPSIGDPWTYSPEKEQLEDLFQDVVVDGTSPSQPSCKDQQQQPMQQTTLAPFVIPTSTSEARNPLDRGGLDPPPDKERPPRGAYTGQEQLRHGSVSPCDSAYCGSPRSLPGGYQYDDGPGQPLHLLHQQGQTSLARGLGRLQKYQSVPVQEDKFSEHKANMQRGFVSNLDQHNACARKRNHSTNALGKLTAPAPALPSVKRRCYGQDSPSAAYGNQQQLAKHTLAPLPQVVNALLQPGTGYGCTGEKRNSRDEPLGNLFLQRNLFSPSNDCGSWNMNLLPELSLRDCEVNAPLLRSDGALPLGPDCVHALDDI